MIKYLESVTPEQMAELKSFCEGSVFGIKALGPVLSYGLSYDFVSAWTQRDEAGHLTAFLSKYYGTVTVHVSPLGDVPELLAFLRAIGLSFCGLGVYRQRGRGGARVGRRLPPLL